MLMSDEPIQSSTHGCTPILTFTSILHFILMMKNRLEARSFEPFVDSALET